MFFFTVDVHTWIWRYSAISLQSLLRSVRMDGDCPWTAIYLCYGGFRLGSMNHSRTFELSPSYSCIILSEFQVIALVEGALLAQSKVKGPGPS